MRGVMKLLPLFGEARCLESATTGILEVMNGRECELRDEDHRNGECWFLVNVEISN